jgi:hypothetical protein
MTDANAFVIFFLLKAYKAVLQAVIIIDISLLHIKFQLHIASLFYPRFILNVLQDSMLGI